MLTWKEKWHDVVTNTLFRSSGFSFPTVKTPLLPLSEISFVSKRWTSQWRTLTLHRHLDKVIPEGGDLQGLKPTSMLLETLLLRSGQETNYTHAKSIKLTFHKQSCLHISCISSIILGSIFSILVPIDKYRSRALQNYHQLSQKTE